MLTFFIGDTLHQIENSFRDLKVTFHEHRADKSLISHGECLHPFGQIIQKKLLRTCCRRTLGEAEAHLLLRSGTVNPQEEDEEADAKLGWSPSRRDRNGSVRARHDGCMATSNFSASGRKHAFWLSGRPEVHHVHLPIDVSKVQPEQQHTISWENEDSPGVTHDVKVSTLAHNPPFLLILRRNILREVRGRGTCP